jgi:site-specific recombinase XerD
MEDAVEWYLLALKAKGRSPDTIRNRTLSLGQVVAYAQQHGRTYLDDLTPTLVRAVMADLMAPDRPGRPPNWQGGQGQATSIAASCRDLSRELHKEGLRVADLSVVKNPRVPERIQPRTTADEFRALEQALRQRLIRPRVDRLLVSRDAALLAVLADTGLRAMEVCKLDLTDVDMATGTITVRQGKGGKSRSLPIVDPDPLERDGGPTMRALRDYLVYRQQRYGVSRERALWLTREGRRLKPKALRQVLASLCLDAGLENRPPHAFRRGWFSENYADDPRTLPTLVARMGWSENSAAMIRTYTRGVDLELASSIPLPLNSRRWRERSTSPRAAPSFVQPLMNDGPASRLENVEAGHRRRQPRRNATDTRYDTE